MDRGFLDGKTISRLKKHRGVDVSALGYPCAVICRHMRIRWLQHIMRLVSRPWSMELALEHPSRENQQIKRIEHVDYMWEECSVRMDGCVVRELKEGRDGSGGRED